MKIGRFLALFVLIGGLLIAFGDRGLVDSHNLRKRLMAMKEENKEIARRNKELQKICSLLKDDLAYIEMTARRDLGMVKKGEMVYRLSP